MISAGALIWTSVRPLIRTFLTIGAGFALTKADLFPLEAARGAGQIVLHIFMPCLLFSRIVPAFTPDNVGTLGPVTLVGVLYGVLGILLAFAIKQVFWVPHRFRWGIIVAGGWGNYGDIPTAIALGVTASAPFNGVEDQNLAVAYIAGLLLVFFVTLFPMGGYLLVAKDYDGPDIESDYLRERMHRRRTRVANAAIAHLRRLRGKSTSSAAHPESAEDEKMGDERSSPSTQPREPSERIVSCATSTAPTVVADERDMLSFTPPTHTVRFMPSLTSLTPSPRLSRPRRILRRARPLLAQLIKPAPLTIILALPIALVAPLKALFLPPSASFTPRFHPTAPDGQPPLAFMMDTASFAGAASVPLGLVCLGSALARLTIGGSDNWARMPLGAIGALAVGKMIISPVFGVLLVKGLVHSGMIDRNDKVLQFVCIIFSGLPTATTQVFLTQVYSTTGSAEHLSAFLIPQYLLMFLTMTALTVYTLNSLF
ncbi:auxin efflux carrier [Auriscalpium vulgare]|uniref:Auxin efflux carrier n=1 Tax=Auriscalpium vulgare TaxID=40419 RepID=A0ACB8RIB1_9AGAM|nr:auxin efflux carrier [Auriscalpium vulgare]